MSASAARRYEIRVEGALDERWSAWFEGLRITSRRWTTTLAGPVVDQAALIGLLVKVHDLGLTLISVRRIESRRPSRRRVG
jgi:hypothetical protein